MPVLTADVMKFTNYDAIGFDMDFTLARYNLVPFFPMVYGHMVDYLVNVKNYDRAIFHNLHDDKDLIYKGLITDFERGNVLKLGYDGTILRATHGTRRLKTWEIEKEYGREKKFDHFEDLENGSKNGKEKWGVYETYFEVPCQSVFTMIVDDYAKRKTDKIPYKEIHDDVVMALLKTYIPMDEAAFYSHMRSEENMKKYIDPASEQIKNWLKNLKQNNNCVLFLLTSSFPEFTTHLMTRIYGPNWKSFFDLIIYGSRKPSFFVDEKPFQTVEKFIAAKEVSELEVNGEYIHGNSEVLMEFLREQTERNNPKVLYFGDSLWSDARPCKMVAGWDTVLVLEEMDAEGYAVSDGTVPGHEDECSNGPQRKKPRKYEHSTLITPEEEELMVSEFWGSIFVDRPAQCPEGNRPGPASRQKTPTAFGRFVSQYADICVPSIEYLAGVPVDHEFKRFIKKKKDSDDTDYHPSFPGNVTGYHPGLPKSMCA